MKRFPAFGTKLLVWAFAACLAVSTATATDAAKSTGKKEAVKAAKKLAEQLAPMLLDELGIQGSFVDEFFGVSKGAPPIDYERIAGIVADVISDQALKEKLKAARIEINSKHTRLGDEIRAYRKARARFDAARKGQGDAALTIDTAVSLTERDRTIRALQDSIRDIEKEALHKLEDEKKGTYLWATGANLRLGAALLLSREGGTRWGADEVLREVKLAIDHVKPYANFEARLSYVECDDGGHVVDNFTKDKTAKGTRLSWDKDDCAAFLPRMKSLLRAPNYPPIKCACKYSRYTDPNDCSGDNDWNLYIWDPTYRAVGREGRNPSLRINGSFNSRNTCLKDKGRFLGLADAIRADGRQKEDYLQSIVASWDGLRIQLERDKQGADCVTFYEDAHASGDSHTVCGTGGNGYKGLPHSENNWHYKVSSFVCASGVERVHLINGNPPYQSGVLWCADGGDLAYWKLDNLATGVELLAPGEQPIWEKPKR